MPAFPPRHVPRGFTLVELLVTLAVAAILLGVAAPSFRDVVQRNRQESALYALTGSLQLARSEAIKRSTRVSVCARGAGDGVCGTSWSRGWQVFVDDGDTPGSVDAADGGGAPVLRVVEALASGLRLGNTAQLNDSARIERPFVRFGPRGTSNWRGGGTFVLCIGDETETARAVDVTLSGDVRHARRDGPDASIDAFGQPLDCAPIAGAA